MTAVAEGSVCVDSEQKWPAEPVSGVSVAGQRSTDIVARAFQCRQLEGTEPYAREVILEGSFAAPAILPDGARVERSALSYDGVVALARVDGGSILVQTRPTATSVNVSARTDAAVAEIVARVVERAPIQDASGKVVICAWHQSLSGGVNSAARRLTVPRWDDIARNYPPRVRDALDRLMRVKRPAAAGKLILWHGDPGTGKTTALRALLRSWEAWCAPQYIEDPERFFAVPAYISEVLGSEPLELVGPTLGRTGASQAMWRLIIAEDSDEYLRASARRDAGAGLGRLLNLADGILGQGLNTLVLLTTNEELHGIHPGLTRPGRSLARVEFERFNVDEARRWLPSEVKAPDVSATLAELFERRGDLNRIGVVEGEPPVGQYL